ncbi:MAG: PAS domain-containing protein, partial [Saprospiraceae bacterium]|nr:PAS domain-containing protein [Saprospiraceae bacterium]
IVFANRAFRRLTGYSEDEIIGRNCRFLQGPETDPREVARMNEAIAQGEVFVNELVIFPVRDNDGKISKFVSLCVGHDA